MAGHRSRRRSARRRDRGEATLDQSPHRVAPAERNHEGSVDSNDGGKASSDGEAAEVESGVGVADDRVASNAKKGVTGAVVVPFAADASPTVDDSVPTVSLPLMGLAATTKGDGFAVNAEDPAASARDATARDSVQFQNFQPPSSGLIHLQLPRGPLGVNIKKSPNGECVVSYSHDASPLRVGDVVVSLNGVKLVFVEGGNKAWAELFKDPSVSQRNLVVARCPKAGTANARVWWTDSEKARFDSGVIIWGWSSWAHIASYIPTRTKRQICKYANTLKETREDHFEKLKLERMAYRQRTQMQSSAEQNSDLTRSISIAPTNVKEDDDQLQNLIALSAQRSKNYVNGQNRASLLPSSDFVARPKMEHELLYQQPGQMQLDPEEKWELKAVRTASEILQDCPTRCRCGAVACSMWASNLAPEDLQNSCLDCQENDYGGWPEKKSEVPINMHQRSFEMQ